MRVDTRVNLDREWIDKIFNCLRLFFGHKWSKQFNGQFTEEFYKTQWQSALHGCTYDEIKNALRMIKSALSMKDSKVKVPHQMKFYEYCKGWSTPFFMSNMEIGTIGTSKPSKEGLHAKKENIDSSFGEPRMRDFVRNFGTHTSRDTGYGYKNTKRGASHSKIWGSPQENWNG